MVTKHQDTDTDNEGDAASSLTQDIGDDSQDQGDTSTLAGSAMDIVNEQRRDGKITGATVGKFLSRLGKAKVKDVNVDPSLGGCAKLYLSHLLLDKEWRSKGSLD